MGLLLASALKHPLAELHPVLVFKHRVTVRPPRPTPRARLMALHPSRQARNGQPVGRRQAQAPRLLLMGLHPSRARGHLLMVLHPSRAR